ncbi:HypA protein [Purpureocillium lavendulum]|uniref:HypA protein n=1 Tax=Purpureocillium lavendulum TaxID=1247861 RepID=A0AB34FJ08_9HYPO|nr:HypA protein [Purpureocillium lavendulum]
MHLFRLGGPPSHDVTSTGPPPPPAVASITRLEIWGKAAEAQAFFQISLGVGAAYSIRTDILASMATAYRIQVPARDTGLWKADQTQEAATKVTELLQRDLEHHHVFFNASGFHNHILHQLLTLYSTGADASLLQAAYDKNKTYQIKAMGPHPTALADLQAGWDAHAHKYLGKGRHYPDFLKFFQGEIDARGWQAVVEDYLFADTPRARDMLGRLFAGFLHPMIQLMYGVEWEQPAIVAQGLSQAAVHEDRLGAFLRLIDDAAAKTPKSAEQQQRSVAEICEAVRREDEKLATSARWKDPNRIYDGVMVRAHDEAVALLAQIRVLPEDLEERTVEMIHTAAYIAAGASWNPPYIPKFDFFLIHHLTSAPFFLALNRHDWVPEAARVRLLEWKLRVDAVEYIARGSPPLRLTEALASWPSSSSSRLKRDNGETLAARDLLPRFHAVVDDGHTIKAARALLLAQEVSRPYEGKGRPWMRIEGERAWATVMDMLLRSVEGDEYEWVRSAGFEEAWEGMPKLE